MVYMIWAGAAVTFLGVIGLVYCILLVTAAKRAKVEDAQLRAVLQRALVWNMGALALSALGLMMVVLGVILA